MLHVRLFGSTTVEFDGSTIAGSDLGGVKPRQILEVLALEVGSPVAKDRLADLLWDGRPPSSYMGTLESYVCVLRRSLGLPSGRRSLLATTSSGYRLDPAGVSVDVQHFSHLVGKAAAATGREAVVDTEEALQLVRGNLLADEPYAAWALRARAYFSREIIAACVRASRLAAGSGDVDAALRFSQFAVDQDVFSEDAVHELMRALWVTGRRCEALQVYAQMRQTMLDDLGEEPSGRTRALYIDILRGDAHAGQEATVADGVELRTLLRLLRQTLDAMPKSLSPAAGSALTQAAALLAAG